MFAEQEEAFPYHNNLHLYDNASPWLSISAMTSNSSLSDHTNGYRRRSYPEKREGKKKQTTPPVSFVGQGCTFTHLDHDHFKDAQWATYIPRVLLEKAGQAKVFGAELERKFIGDFPGCYKWYQSMVGAVHKSWLA
ncbi:hypothetical protein QYF36_016600 [Acer negundo]|nr:hypothetical protein QYF36_016600 [Acer negundo]